MRRIKFVSPNIDGALKEREIKKVISDIYIPCPCGSGKKYKFCCYGIEDKKFHSPNELYMYVVKQKNKKAFCIHNDEKCHKEIIKAHSIQNNRILSKLATDGHVYVAEFNANKFGGLDFKKCGKNEATTATCFCKFHDVEIFKDIELKDYNYEEKQNFLYAYRAFSKYYYDRIVALADYRDMFKVSPNFMLVSGSYDRIKGLEKSVEENESIKNAFNAALDKGQFDDIVTITITLDYEVSFATAYMSPLSYDLEGNIVSNVWSLSDRVKNIYVSIFPEKGKTYILISWLKEDDDYKFDKFREQFQEVKQNEDVLLNVLNNMVACQSDNFVFSKRLLDSWGEEKIEVFRHQCMSSFLALNGKNIGLAIEKNIKKFKCLFDLFENIK